MLAAVIHNRARNENVCVLVLVSLPTTILRVISWARARCRYSDSRVCSANPGRLLSMSMSTDAACKCDQPLTASVDKTNTHTLRDLSPLVSSSDLPPTMRLCATGQ